MCYEIVFYLEKLSSTLVIRGISYYNIGIRWKLGDEMDKEMLKGSIDLLLLSLIKQRDLYGYEITKLLKQLSDDHYEMSEGTLYPALKRLERKQWIESYWSETSSGRRKYYKLTDLGTKELVKKQRDWKLIENLVQKSSGGLL